MEKLSGAAEAVMEERFGKDNVIALATDSEGMPA